MVVSETDEWVLLNAHHGSAHALAEHLRSTGLDAFVASSSTTGNDQEIENLFPGHVFVHATIEEKQSSINRRNDWTIVTNGSNRPFVIPGPVAMALKCSIPTTCRDLTRFLLTMAPEYRVEQLLLECARWHITQASKS